MGLLFSTIFLTRAASRKKSRGESMLSGITVRTYCLPPENARVTFPDNIDHHWLQIFPARASENLPIIWVGISSSRFLPGEPIDHNPWQSKKMDPMDPPGARDRLGRMRLVVEYEHIHASASDNPFVGLENAQIFSLSHPRG